MGDTRNYAALEWVVGEIGDTLKEARQALEAYVEDPKDSTRIRFCLTHIHQVHGTLHMVEFHGASLLAEEMEQLAQALLNNTVSSAAEAQEVLMRSLLQLPIYLDHVKTQRDDHPGVILPLLNDLRAVRKQSYLSETNLFAPDLSPAKQLRGQRHPVTQDAQKLEQVLGKLREMYQFAAAAVLRGVKIEENLAYLNKVCTRLESLTAGTRSYAVWQLAAALVDALERDDLELSVAVRGLLRHLARELRLLSEGSPTSLDRAPRESLLKNLLYYVARADEGSERVAQIKQAYKLNNALLYGDSPHAQDKDFISAPDPEAIRSVVVALQDEIDTVKHILDLSLSGQGELEDLRESLPVIKRIADTLAVLGIGDLRKQIVEQQEAVADICDAGSLDEDRLMQVAGRIIEIEHRLQAVAKGAGKSRDLASVDERGMEIDMAKSAVLAECQKGLEQAKDAIVEYIASKWDSSHLANVSSLMSDIRGGLEMIPLRRPAAIMDTCGRYVQEQLLDAQITPDWETLDKLADTIASVDYYLERLQEDREEDLDGLLDIAEQSINSLGYAVAEPETAEPLAAEPTAETEAGALESPEEISNAEPEVSEEDAVTADAELGSGLEADAPATNGPSVHVAAEQSADSDTAEQPVPGGDDSALEQKVSDFEVSQEAEEQRNLETGTLPVEDIELASTSVADSAAESQVPDEASAAADFDADSAELGITQQDIALDEDHEQTAPADDLPVDSDCEFDGVVAETSAASEETRETASDAVDAKQAQPVSAVEKPESDIDDEIIEIFIEEAAEVQETLAEYFPQWRQDHDDQDSLTIVRRAFHTLKGSGRMVEARDIGELAWSIENMLNRVIDNSIQPQDEHFALIAMVLELMPSLVDAFEKRVANPNAELTQRYMDWAFAAADGDVTAELRRAASRGAAAEPEGAAKELHDHEAALESGDEHETQAGGFDEQAEQEETVDAWGAADELAAPDDLVAAEESDEEEDSDEGDDLILWEIFASEAESHLAAVEEFVAQMEDAAPLYTPPSDSMQRALHTLKGSAHMAHVTPIAELATPFESFVKELRAYQVNINDDILQLMKDGVDYTRVGLESIQQAEPVVLPKLQQFLARTAELRELAVGALVRQKEVEKDGMKQVDPRLLSIFMAEEMKLLLDADEILDRWQQDYDDRTEMDPLVAELTTLEAGANQANLPEMAELSHLLGDIHAACLAGQLTPNPALVAELQSGHNLLLDLVDAVAAGQNLPPLGAELVASLRALLDDRAPGDEGAPGEVATGHTSDATSREDFSADEPDWADEQNVLDSPDAASSDAVANGDSGHDIRAHELTDEQSDSVDGYDPTFDVDQHSAAADSADELGTDEFATGLDSSEGAEASETWEDSISLDDTALPSAEDGPVCLDEQADSTETEVADANVGNAEVFGEESGRDALDISYASDLGDEDESVMEPALEPFGGEEIEADADDNEEEAVAPMDSVFQFDDDEDVESVEQGTETSTIELPESAKPEEDAAVAEIASEALKDSTADFEAPGVSAEHSALVIDPDEDFDADIIEIFLEEADELMEELDEAVHNWESNWEDSESPETMARALHTLKGGARLANLMALGQLTHEYESYLLSKNKDQLNQGFFDTLQAYQDRLMHDLRNVHAAMAGEAPPSTPAPAIPEAEAPDGVSQGEDVAVAPPENEAVDGVPSVEAEQAPGVDYQPVSPSTSTANVVPFSKPVPKVPGAREREQHLSGLPGGGNFSMPSASGGSAQAAQAAPRRAGPQEVIKISAELLEELVNLAGETSISRGRLETQINDLGSAIDEIDGTLSRLQEQLRRLDIETEAQIIFRQEQLADHEDFDPLEMDRYSALQQLSRSLMESASDLVDLKSTLNDKVKDTETLLLQQSRVNTNLQEGLMRSRMVPFSRLVPRLRRIVRQVAAELGKNVDFELDNIEGEMDRSVLERMVAPLEHMLRNAVDHGIEAPADRAAAGKSETGHIRLSLAREGSDVLLRLIDDGRGINLARVRQKAIERGLMSADAELSDQDVMQFILHAGFSTAENVTQISGRGVGMDVVHSEIKQLGGSMSIASEAGQGTEFSVRLPFTVSVNRALMVNLGSDQYAIPLNAIEGIVRVSPFELEHYYSNPDARFEYAGENFQVRYMGSMLNEDMMPRLEAQSLPLPVILVRSAQHAMALQVDGLMGSREIVVKSLGQQFSAVQGLSGATVMGDGSVVVILDLHALVRKEMAQAAPTPVFAMEETARLAQAQAEALKTVMVVDDSVTVRKVTTRFLEREGYNVITAKDGVDALRILQEELPDIMLLDIEMPRMDGFEVAKTVRTTSRWQDIPIIMITSRTGEKHREHALSLGVNQYMGKPYQEEMLLESIAELLEQPR